MPIEPLLIFIVPLTKYPLCGQELSSHSLHRISCLFPLFLGCCYANVPFIVSSLACCGQIKSPGQMGCNSQCESTDRDLRTPAITVKVVLSGGHLKHFGLKVKVKEFQAPETYGLHHSRKFLSSLGINVKKDTPEEWMLYLVSR